MAVFRIERTRDYTVMSNHHLRNHELSLKAKGLLSMMLSLPDDWNYTTRGLAKICKEGVDAIGGALRELEGAGYIVRHQLRDQHGRICDTEYVIYEHGTHFVFPESMLKTMLPVGSGLFVKLAFRAARKYPEECRRARFDIDRRVRNAVAEWKSAERD